MDMNMPMDTVPHIEWRMTAEAAKPTHGFDKDKGVDLSLVTIPMSAYNSPDPMSSTTGWAVVEQNFRVDYDTPPMPPSIRCIIEYTYNNETAHRHGTACWKPTGEMVISGNATMDDFYYVAIGARR